MHAEFKERVDRALQRLEKEKAEAAVDFLIRQLHDELVRFHLFSSWCLPPP